MSEAKIRCGTVMEVRPDRLSVRLDPPGEREECTSCAGCAEAGGGPGRVLAVAAAPGLRPGDRTQVEIPAVSTAWAATALFLVPLACLGAGAGLWTWLASLGILPESQALALLAGLFLMALWQTGLALHERGRRRRGEKMPRIVDAPPGRPG